MQNFETVANTPKTFKRNALGLFDHINYAFTESGEIDWLKMVEEKYLFPNKDYFNKRGLPIPTSIDGLAENQLLIKLMGLKKLLKLRGYSSITYRFGECQQDYTRMICQIVWEPNFETNGKVIITESAANASINNVDPFVAKFCETICENRSLARNIRSFLGIDICSQEEIDASKNKVPQEEEQEVALPSPQSALKKALKEIGVDSRESFVAYLDQLTQNNICNFPDYKNWKSSNDVPVKESRIIIALTKENKFIKS